jgi:hypothetical protein
MKNSIIGVLVVLSLVLSTVSAACTAPGSKPVEQPEKRALEFYEFYSPF